ncbi:MAG: VWA domain-containing protein [Lachnospiraceae bacterium]|nr:VWA domain-containing protein [Lachnospiraceae bacterium]
MKSLRLSKIRYFFCCILVLLLANITFIQVAADNAVEKKQIIFILDGSYSMAQDRWQEAVDGVAMIVSMLPTNYEVAMLVYSDDVTLCTEFGQPIKEQLELLREVETAGYTNTGLAVQTALERFGVGEVEQRRIVLISDGEISMKKQQDTESAIGLYAEAVEYARRENVVIDMILFEPDGFEEQIVQGAVVTNGHVYRKADTESIIKYSEMYLFERLGVGRIVAGTSDTLTSVTDISFQDALAEKVWILITAESEIADVQVSCQSKEISTTKGKYFVVIELDEPLENTANLKYTLTEQGQVEIYISKEYKLSVDMEAVCLPEYFEPQVVVSIRNAEGKSLLEDPNTNEKVNIYIEDKKMDYTIEEGNAVINYPVEASQEVKVLVEFEQLDGRVVCDDFIGKIWLEKPYQEIVKEEESYILLYIVIAGICLVFVLSLLLLLRAKKKTEQSAKVPPEARGTGETPKYDFSGQLVVYMLKNSAGEDMPPASVNLYMRESREPFSFAWVRDKCRMDMQLKDADRVQFQGGEQHTLCVKNQGDATVVCGKEILLRNKKYILHYNEKLLLIFNDGEIELEVHYKNMKPSERKR